MKTTKIIGLALFCVGLTTASLPGQVIDFEKLPNGSTPTPGMEISNQFATNFGVSFQMGNGSFPKIAKVNDASFAAFTSGGGSQTNVPLPNQNVGSFFLTGHMGLSSPPYTMIVTYSTPTAAASGVILDIDDREFWSVLVYTTHGTVETNTLYSPFFAASAPNSGDQVATPWSVSHTNADISSIEFLGNNLNGIKMGWGFDIFSPRSATPPPTLSISTNGQGVQIGVAGTFGSTNRIQFRSAVGTTNWQVLTNAVLTNAPVQFYTDFGASNQPSRLYRAILLP